MMEPWEEMRAAAKVLREAAQEPQRWEAVIGTEGEARVLTPHDGLRWREVANCGRPMDATWMALMGPDKAELLAVWLETEASCHGAAQEAGKAAANLVDSLPGAGGDKTTFTVVDSSGPALSFARAVLATKGDNP